MKTITITLGETKTAKAVNTDAWYVRAEANIKEALHSVQVRRVEANEVRASLREELDAQYKAEARAQMVRLMAKRGLEIKFD
jgi:hypothetical protein